MTRRVSRKMPCVTLLVLAGIVSRVPDAKGQPETASATPAINSKGTAPCADPTFRCTEGMCRLDVSFPATDKCVTRIDDAFVRAKKASRITEKTTLRIRVVNVNLLRYALGFETKETVVESYVYLEKLWKQIVGLGKFGGLSPSPSATEAESGREQAFVDAINAWRDALGTESGTIDDFVANFTALSLEESQKSEIAMEIETLPGRLKTLTMRQASARQAISRVEHFAAYDETMMAHQAVVDKVDAFKALGTQITIGFEKKIPFGAAGRAVAVTITATDKESNREQPQVIDVEFLVHSTLPVTFHAGYTVRAIKELMFESVASSIQAAGGADLFAKVQDSEVNGTLTALMSYRLCDISRTNRCPHLTIGTDFKNAGERLYGGVSWAFGHAFITVGVVSGETKKGEGAVTDALGAAGQLTGSRELFTAISTKRKWGGFFGVSFAPF